MIIARLIWNFDLSFGDEESKNLLDCKSYAIWIKRRLQVRLTLSQRPRNLIWGNPPDVVQSTASISFDM